MPSRRQATCPASNGRVTSTQTVNLLDEWAYDAYGAPNHFDARDAASSLLALDCTRDNGGRITQIQEALLGGAATPTTYDYDAAGRLATVAAGAISTARSATRPCPTARCSTTRSTPHRRIGNNRNGVLENVTRSARSQRDQ